MTLHRMEKKLKVILSGGGTGGHIFPAIAIAEEIKKRFPQAEFLFFGANGKMEMEKVPQLGYRIEGLDIVGFNRGNLLSNLKLPFKLFSSIEKAKSIVKEFKPDFAVGTGGFASGPALYAATRLGVPTFIQEQNAHAGVTNKILSKSASLIFTAYPNVKGFPQEKTEFYGNPIRERILSGLEERSLAKQKFGLDPNKLTLLSVGGSLGSHTMNQAWLENRPKLLDKDYQLIWQTGKSEFRTIESQTKHYTSRNLQVLEFIKEMEVAYSAADIIVSRAGAIAISELAVVGKPMILIPFPFAAEDHQTANAQRLVEKKAALMVKDSEMKEKFWPTLRSLCENEEVRKEMSENLEFFAKRTAAKDIVDSILTKINRA